MIYEPGTFDDEQRLRKVCDINAATIHERHYAPYLRAHKALTWAEERQREMTQSDWLAVYMRWPDEWERR